MSESCSCFRNEFRRTNAALASFGVLMALSCAPVVAQAHLAVRVIDPAPSADQTIVTSESAITLKGVVSGAASGTRVLWESSRGFGDTVAVHGAAASADASWTTTAPVALRPGLNHISVRAIDPDGRASEASVNVIYTGATSESASAPQVRSSFYRGYPVTYEVANGVALYEGDIVLGTAQELELARSQGPGPGLSASGVRWPVVDGVGRVPYSISARDRAVAGALSNINAAVSRFNTQLAGVIQFVEATSSDTNRIEFDLDPARLSGSGQTEVGFEAKGVQTIGGAINATVPTILHQMGHAIGLWHEQSRTDRHNYVNFLEANADRTRASNLDQLRDHESTSGLYDYASLMHDAPVAYSIDGVSPTLESIPAGIPLGSRTAQFSTGDVDAISRLYGHAPTAVTIDTNPSGLAVVVDGVRATAPQTFNWAVGSQHTLEVSAGAQALSGRNFIFGRWNALSGGAAQTITVTAGDGSSLHPSSSPAVTSYLASFIPIHFYNPVVHPDGSATITATPAPSTILIDGVSTSYYTDRQQVKLSVSPKSGLAFYGWRQADLLNYYSNPFSFRVHSDLSTLQAVVVSDPVTTLSVTSADAAGGHGFALAVDGTAIATPRNFDATYDGSAWAAGKSHQLCGTAPVNGACPSAASAESPASSSVSYSFSGWTGTAGSQASNGLAIQVKGNQTFSANYSARYRSLVLTAPSCAGNTVASAATAGQSIDEFVAHGSSHAFTANAGSGFTFVGWSGDLSGTTTTDQVTVAGQVLGVANFNATGTNAPLRVTSFSPGNATSSANALDVRITGSGFSSNPNVTYALFNGTARSSTFVSDRELVVHLQAGDLAAAGSYRIGVYNAAGSGCGAYAESIFDVRRTSGTPSLSVEKTHTGSFNQGQRDARYTVAVTNTGTASTDGTPVRVTSTMPTGLSLSSMSGTGWSCTAGGDTCSRSDTLNAEKAYAPLTVSVNVASNATTPQVPHVTVSGGGSPDGFHSDLTTLAQTPASITATGGTPQSADTYSDFALPLQATVTDSGGNPVSGVTVTFAAPTTGATASIKTSAVTNSAGVVSLGAAANGTVGSYTVTATVSGVSTPASFSLTNVKGTAGTVTATSGTPQTAATNTAFAQPLLVTVTDTGGNPMGGVGVTFAAPASGASATLSATSGTTNALGQVKITATANGTGGQYTVTATVKGVTNPANFVLTNSSGTPASVTATGGTPQTTNTNTAFPTALQATVKDSGGNLLSGITVNFSAPASGASATLSSSSAVTNSSGIASVTATANSTAGGPYNVTASVSGVSATASFALTNNSDPPASVTATGGTPQTSSINTAFPAALQATVKDSGGNPLSGITVSFSAPSSGASAALSGSSAVTNASGIASITATANGTAGGPYSVTATVGGVGTPATFSLTNTTGTSITATGGTPQSANTNANFTTPLQVTVKSGSTPVSGATVTYTVPASGASATLSSKTAVTNGSGIASVTATANATTGSYSVTATVAGSSTPATFSLTNTTPTPAAITATGGTPQSADTYSDFAAPLQATVTDASGHPISGVTVTFTAPTSGATASIKASAITNSAGVATDTAAANGTVGSYSVTATVSGVSTPATFSLSNVKGTPGAVTATSGTPQYTTPGTAFSQPLLVTVTDTGGNVMGGVAVTFAVPASGASATLSAMSGTTNGLGQVKVTATANSINGSYTVTASVKGVATAASFALTNTTGTPASVTATGGTPQTANTGMAFATALQATVKDSSGNPLSGITVNFSAPPSGASATLSSSTAATNSSGVASVTATANSTAGGPYSVTASVSGVSGTASFSLTNKSDPPASVTATGGTPQTASINTAFSAALQATVKDSGGNPLSGITVNFSAPASGASATLSSPSAVTNASGVASVTATANATAGGPYSVTASVTGVSGTASFSLTNSSGTSITASGGTPQSANTSANFTVPLQVTVTSGGSPVSGATVTYTVPASGASATLSSKTAVTNGSGIASVTATANATTGSYSVTATVAGSSTPATFSLTNTTPTPAAVSATGGTPQSANTYTNFALPLQATVTDSSGHPVSGVTVTFTAPTSGATATIKSTAVTNSAGIASDTAAANGTAGSYSVTAAVSGVNTPATFALTNVKGVAAAITATSGTPQNTAPGTAFAQPLLVTVTDSGGNPVGGIGVTFAVPASGPSATLSAMSGTTNALGQLKVTATANSTGGTYSVTASTKGVSTPASFALTNSINQVTLPSNTSLIQGQTASYQVTLLQPAPSGGLTVTLSSNNTSAVTVTSSVSIAAGQTTPATQPQVTAVNFGSATITASAPGYTSGTGAVTVTATVTFSPNSLTVKPGTQQNLELDLSPAASAAGLTVSLSSTNTSVATVPSSVTFPANATSVLVPVNAIANGSATIQTAAQPNFASATAAITVATINNALTVGSTSVGQNLQTTATVSLPAAAPAGGISVRVTSGDPSKVVLSDQGLSSVTATISQGQSSVQIVVEGLVSSGSVTLTASAANYTSGEGTVTLTPSGFVLSGSGTAGSGLSTYPGLSTSVTVFSAQLDSSFNFVQLQPVRSGTGVSIQVNVASSNTSVGTVSPSPVTFTGGASSVNTQFNAVAPGTSTLTASSTGFTTSADSSIVATVNQSGLAPPNETVGNHLETSGVVVLNGVAPSGGVTMTLTSNNSSALLLSTTATGAGQSSITLKLQAQATQSPTFYMYGLASTGSATYNVSAPGFTSGTGTVTLTPSGFVIADSFGNIGNSFTTTTASGASTVNVMAAQLDPSGNYVATEPLAGGTSVNVTLTSSNTSVGTISSPVSIAGGSSSGSAQFQPANPGSTTLTANTPTSPAGFSTPASQYRSLTATVATPGIAVTTGISIGQNLQTGGTVVLGVQAPSGGITVTLTSNNTQSLLLSTTENGTGKSSIQVTIAAGANTGSYFIQGFGNPGTTATYSASASSYGSTTGSVTITPSGVVISGPNGLNSPGFVTSTSSGTTEVDVFMAQLNSDDSFGSVQSLAGGLSLSVTLSSSATSVGTITPSVTVTGGSGGSDLPVPAQFTPQGQGQTMVSVNQPAGYVATTTNPNYTSIQADVE